MLDNQLIVNVQGLEYQPIPLDTWENWFQIWLENLAANLPQAKRTSHGGEDASPPVSSAYELSLRLTDDQDIAQFNYQYRHLDSPTDILAFAALETDLPWSEELNFEPLYLGDLIISLETASRQAQAKGHSLNLELAWLASHGFLHLLGWDHPDEESLELMLQKQEKLLKLVDLSCDLLR
jgi:probable rRNA maturation factor